MHTSLHSVRKLGKWIRLQNRRFKTCKQRQENVLPTYVTFKYVPANLIFGGKVMCFTHPTTWLPPQSQSWQCLYAANSVFKNDTRGYINNYAHHSLGDILVVKKKKKNCCPECFLDYELGPCSGSQGKYWRLQNDTQSKDHKRVFTVFIYWKFKHSAFSVCLSTLLLSHNMPQVFNKSRTFLYMLLFNKSNNN